MFYSMSEAFRTIIGIVVGPFFERYYLSKGSLGNDIIWDNDSPLKRPNNIKKDTFYQCWKCYYDEDYKVLDGNFIPKNISRDGFLSLPDYIYKHYGIIVSIHFGSDAEEANFVMVDNIRYKALYSYYSYTENDIKLVLYSDSVPSYTECLVSINNVTNTKLSRNKTINDILGEI